MTAFDDAWIYTQTIRGWFSEINARKLFQLAMAVPEGGRVVEVGTSWGRSASLLITAEHARKYRLVLVDNWPVIEELDRVREMCDRMNSSATIIHMDSVAAAALVVGEIDLLFVDGNHANDGPSRDCESWLPKVKSGGIACWHDYGGNHVDVAPAVDAHTQGWERLGNFDSLEVRRKP
jgi:predicted O-methyltransferase YrrM